MNDALRSITADLAAGAVILLDGPTGTELEQRGAEMHEGSWAAMASETHPEILLAIYEDYVRAGARIITTNTFTTNRFMLEPAGLGDRFEQLNTKALQLAHEARERTRDCGPIAIAGAMSHQMPRYQGRMNPEWIPSLAQARAAFDEMAGLLAGEGADVLLLEMMSDPDYANLAIEAARNTGLPIWVGFSVRRSDDGVLVSNARREMAIEDMFSELEIEGVDVAGVMHSSANDTGPALEALRSVWAGPTMAYPDSGFFRMPNWVFEDILPENELINFTESWVKTGTQLIGTCCGLGLKHFRALATHFAPKAAAPS